MNHSILRCTSPVTTTQPAASPVATVGVKPGHFDAVAPPRKVIVNQHHKNGTSLAVLAEGLSRTFGSITAVDDLTLHIKPGEVFGLLGPQGAGKTTALRMLAGQLAPTSGSALVAGMDIHSAHHARKIRSLTALTPQQGRFDAGMTGPEVLYYFARLLNILQDERANYVKTLLTTLHLWDERTNQVANDYTPRMQHRLGMARALVHSPKIVFLDEPTASLEQEDVDMVHDLLTHLSAKNRTIVFATQSSEEADRLCDRVSILNAGVH